MEAFLDHLLRFEENVVFIEKDTSKTFKEFVSDILETVHLIREQIQPEQMVFQWNYATTYSNIVCLFSIACCKGIVVPESVATRLFPENKKQIISCFGTTMTVFEIEQNEFTQELKRRNSPGLIIATSGTGNVPRDIVIDFGLLCLKYLKLHSKFRSILIFSLEHISGIETLLSIISPGGTMVLEKNRTPSILAESIQRNQTDLIACTPSFLIQLYLKDFLNEIYFKSVRIINCGGETLSEQWKQKFRSKIQFVDIRQAFGTTESTNIRTYTNPDDATGFKPGIRDLDYMINNNILYLKNRYYTLGNWTENKINRDAWIATTDLVEEDENGFLKITGRTEKIISVGAQKVNPVEIENIISKLPFIEYVKVYGEKNILLGEIVIADVLCKKGILTEVKKMIRNFCKQQLEEYKIPVKINLLKEVPVTLRFKNSIW